MKKTLFISLALISTCYFLFSCINQDKDYSIDQVVDKDLELNTDFNFSLKSEKQMNITAKDADNNPSQTVKVGVYAQTPYTEDGVFNSNISPIFVGYTNADGMINAKLVVAQNITKLYVLPFTSGFGEMQVVDIKDYMTTNLQGATFENKSYTRSTETVGCTPTIISGIYQAYSIYADSDVNEKGIPTIGGSSLVSKEKLDNNFINLVNSWYPEKQNVQTADLSKNTDLVVNHANGAEVWITYIGDGEFSVLNSTTYNSLFYYNYQKNDLKGRSDIYPKVRMTLALPNTNEKILASGVRVQLLYWDNSAQAYSKVFPKGTHIGFAVARKGYKMDKTSINKKEAYSFKNTNYPTISDPQGFYYSTPALNFTNHAQSVTRVANDYNCCVTGFDIRRSDDSSADFDFNDVLFKVSTSPVLAALPEEEIPVIDEETTAEALHGTLAFEDQWPAMGDYDFNDAVINYTYALEKNSKNEITKIKLTFTPIAKGAAPYTRIGFGIELPISSSNISSINGAKLEDGNSLATIVIWDQTNLFMGSSGFVNTFKGQQSQSFTPATVELVLSNPTNDVSMLNFNPFLFVNGRSREIHLVDYKPTPQMDTTQFGTAKDKSDKSKGIYYRMDNAYPWALDVPRASADSPTWRYPKEMSIISSAYLNYSKWVGNQSDYSWFVSSKPSNINENELY